MKKVLSVVLSAMLVFGSLPNIAYASDNVEQSQTDSLNLEIPEGGLTEQEIIDRVQDAEQKFQESILDNANQPNMFSVAPFSSIPLNLVGEGTESAPYLISTAEDLEALAKSTNSGESFANTYFKLTNKIDLSAFDEWEPIGTEANPFSGIFLGSHNYIKHMKRTTPVKYFGLFGYTKDAKIKDLNMEDVEVKALDFSGSLVGYSADSFIFNCKVIGELEFSGRYAGGLVGSLVRSEIGKSKFSGKITSLGIAPYNIGGIVGTASNSKITNSSFNGEISNQSTITGGIVGQSNLSIIDKCSANGIIRGKTDTGGIVGINYNGKILHAKMSGEVHGATGIGGIAGANVTTTNSEIAYCLNKAYIKSMVKTDGDSGGIIGSHLNTSTSGSLYSVVKECANTGIVEAGHTVGGIIGRATGHLALLNCYNTGNVSATLAGMAGGIIGRFNEPNNTYIAQVNNCYNAGTVTAAGSFKGGIIGYSNSLVNKCYILANGVLGLGNDTTFTTKILSSEALKNLNGDIASPFILDADDSNQGYPILNSIIYNDVNAHVGKKFRYGFGKSETKDYEADYFYKDDYFTKSAYTYNPSLATMSLCMELSAWGSQDEPKGDYLNRSKNARQLFADIGFKDFYTNEWFTKKPTRDSIAVAFANKSLNVSGEDYTLIAIGVRGGGYESEWASNFTMGKEGQHQGFRQAKAEVLKELNKYALENNITGKVKVWITGFSRGSAPANLVAGALDNESARIANCTLERKDVYAYCFATPQGATSDENPKDAIYNNIFNIINQSDPVPRVAPRVMSEISTWKFDRYGVDLLLPDASDTPDYLAKKSVMLEAFYGLESTGAFTIDEFKFFSLREEVVEAKKVDSDKASQKIFIDMLIPTLADKVFVSRDFYVDVYQLGIREILGYIYSDSDPRGEKFKKAFAENMKANFHDYKKVMYSIKDYEWKAKQMKSLLIEDLESTCEDVGINNIDAVVIDKFATSLSYYMLHFILNNADFLVTGIWNRDIIFTAHYPDLYLAWMQTMDPNYGGKLGVSFSSGSYRVVRVNCPVDAKVYDKSNKLVAEITNDTPQTIDESGIISSVNADGEKLIYLPAVEEYSVKLKATNDGKMTVSVNEYSYAAQDINRIVNYYDIAIQKDDEFTATIPAYTPTEIESKSPEGSSSNYVLKDANSSVINPNIDIAGDNAIKSNYMVTANSENVEKGEVSGYGVRKLGNFALVEAFAKTGYVFDGWYVENLKVSSEPQYRFCVTSDITLTAKFVENNANPNPNGKLALDVISTSGGKIVDNPSGQYPSGEVIDISAQSDEGYIFKGWSSSNGGTFSDATSLSTKFTMPEGPTILTANFERANTSPYESKNIKLVLKPSTINLFAPGKLDWYIKSLDKAADDMQDMLGIDLKKKIEIIAVDNQGVLMYGSDNMLYSTTYFERCVKEDFNNSHFRRDMLSIATAVIWNDKDFVRFNMPYPIMYMLEAYLVENGNLTERGNEDGKMYVGKEYINYYKKLHDSSIASGKYTDYSMAYSLLRIKDTIGWKPFRLAMQDLVAFSKTNPEPWKVTYPQRINMLLDGLAKHSGTDVYNLFTADEIRIYEKEWGGKLGGKL